MSAELLREAAAKARELATAATPGPWADPYFEDEREHPGDGGWWIHNGQVGTAEYAVAATVPFNPRGQADAEHIAAWHPAVALVAADLWDNAADWVEFSGNEGSDGIRQALAFARVFLGRTP